MITTWLFWGLAAATVVVALLVVSQRNAVRGILMLVALFGAVGGLFILLSAPFAAFAQIAIYAVAWVTVVLPMTLFLDLPDETAGRDAPHPAGAAARRVGVVLAAGLIVELAWAFQHLRGADLSPDDVLPGTRLAAVTIGLVTSHAPLIVLTAMLVLVSAVGVVLLVRRERR